MAAYVPPGWPSGVHPPGSEDFERTAQAWLLDVVPPDYRLHGVLRRYPLALAAMAAHHTKACVAGAREGYRNARTEVGGALPPHALEALLAAYRAEGRRLVATAQAVDLVARALRGEVFTPQLQDTAQPGGRRRQAPGTGTQDPGTQDSDTQNPGAQDQPSGRRAAASPGPESAADRPRPGQPAAKHTAARQLAAGQPMTRQPAERQEPDRPRPGQPTVGQPAAERPAAERQATQPGAERPAPERQATQPGAERPAPERRGAQRPARDGTAKVRKAPAQRPARDGGASARKAKRDQHAAAS